MKPFTLKLFDTNHQHCEEHVVSFIGADKSGSFGIQSHHARFMTVLIFGLSQMRLQNGERLYLALPGGVLYFINNELSISTRHFLIDSNFERISEILKNQMLKEEETLIKTRGSLHKMEQSMLSRLWKLQRFDETST